MALQADIDAQLRLLAEHRRTLNILLQQLAVQTPAFAQPALIHNISNARNEIQYIKRTLQAWGIRVDDFPSDGPPISEQATWSTIGRLRLSLEKPGNSWRFLIKNGSTQELLSVALRIEPPPSLFVSQTRFSIPRLPAHGETTTQLFTLTDPSAIQHSLPTSSPPSYSTARRKLLEDERNRFIDQINNVNNQIYRLENQRRVAQGNLQFQLEAQLQEAKQYKHDYEQELDKIEAQLDRISAPGGMTQQPVASSIQQPTMVSLHILVSYGVAGQAVERAEGDLLVQFV